VLHGGGEYKVEHVVALFNGVRKWWPRGWALRFVAVTDTPIDHPGIEERQIIRNYGSHAAGWWWKMELFGPEQAALDILYFDLDTLIVGDLTQVAAVDHLAMLSDFNNAVRAQSGMMFLPASARATVWPDWISGRHRIMKEFRGDGEYLNSRWNKDAARWQDLLPGQVVSFKVHVRQKKGWALPPEARVLCFHGRPRPWDTPLWVRERAV
jgi:hypothetical protein